MKKYIIFFLIIVLAVVSIAVVKKIISNQQALPVVKVVNQTLENTAGQLTLDDLDMGCPRQDCIPSLDNPKFETAQQADEWLEDDDLVFGIELNGMVRAYPQRILNWHEIVNDNFGSSPIAITFCPLCGSAIAFERVVDGNSVEFGVSGRLYNSNLVMYDRSDEKSYWQQATGKAIIGPQAGNKLKRILMAPAKWSIWLAEHPTTEVLSRDTGFFRDYDLYPYGTYEENGEIWFGIANSDDRLAIKEVVYGFDIEGNFKAYPSALLKKTESIHDKIAGREVVIKLDQDGQVSLQDNESGQIYVPVRTFWFAWAGFYPQTEIYKN